MPDGLASRPVPPLAKAETARPLRVAMFVNEFPALSETFVLNQITGLLDLGHEVTIFANNPRSEPGTHPDVMRYELYGRVVYRDMPQDKLVRMAMVPEIFARRWAHRGTLVKALDPGRYRREATSLNLLYWADRLLDREAFDVIHCHFGIIGRQVAFFREIGALSGKLAVTFHGVDMSACLDREPSLYRHLFATGDLFMPISDRWHRRLLDHGADPARTFVHRMGIDPFRFQMTERGPARGGIWRILTIGRMVEKKGIEYGLRAAAMLAGRGVPLRYDIVGDGPLRPRLEAVAHEAGIADRVFFHGWRVQSEVVDLMRDSDVLLAPSVTDADGDQEGIPVTLMEAMAMGLPVVSTQHSGIPELVTDGRTGYLAPERDVELLAESLHALLRSPNLCREMGFEGRKKVVGEYNIETLNRQLEARYRSLLDPA